MQSTGPLGLLLDHLANTLINMVSLSLSLSLYVLTFFTQTNTHTHTHNVALRNSPAQLKTVSTSLYFYYLACIDISMIILVLLEATALVSFDSPH